MATDEERPRVEREREGGEPVCWLDRVCPDCGRLADVAPPTVCARCGAKLPGDGPAAPGTARDSLPDAPRHTPRDASADTTPDPPPGTGPS